MTNNPTFTPIGADALSRDTIRAIFLAHGFTVKEGQTDLKPYVYEAAEALIRAALASAAPPEREPHPPHRDCGCAECAPSFEPDTSKVAPALQYDAATGTFEGETLPQAAENWAQWCERRCLGGLPEFLRFVGSTMTRAARHPAAPTPAAQGDALGFELEQRGGVFVVQFDDGGCRPASPAEVALWEALQRARGQQ